MEAAKQVEQVLKGCDQKVKDTKAGGVRVLVDTMRQDAVRAYGAFPDRLYVISGDGLVAVQSFIVPTDLACVERWLVAWQQRTR